MDDDLLTAKIAYGFDSLDADKDGRLTEHDHVLMGRSSARSLGHEPDSPQEARLVAAYIAIWRDLHLPSLPPGSEAITREEFIAATAALADDPAAARSTLGALALAFLSIADTDGDGLVDPDEFFTFQRGHFPGIERAASDTAFRRLDRDGNGTLSEDEFVEAVIEYWTSRDPQAPGNWWVGDPARTYSA
ncbi:MULTISPECIES: EF-hand domain-containing protein [unclassified Streptomyces]|uniref:EF-hand domain-containing protein n=1 Tax=unclassified Streptomyces TaxID=2593676 RepID=UPI0006F49BCA|nr:MULTISPECIES: EF-hand domain-containing protein [unclassified Streptomyces]KQX46286.1 histidine kinase [Streptomyces sp. Root1304]KRA81071.1 histidine kinase [Streptomyces sp. Root66D1]